MKNIFCLKNFFVSHLHSLAVVTVQYEFVPDGVSDFQQLADAQRLGVFEHVTRGPGEGAARGEVLPQLVEGEDLARRGVRDLLVELETKAIRKFANGIIVSYSRPSLMIIASGTQFHVYLPWGQHLFSIVS